MTSIPNSKSKNLNKLLPWLDVMAIAAWGVLMVKYWLTGKLSLLIHPNYFALVVAGGFGFLVIAIAKARQLLRRRRREVTPIAQHITLFPSGWASALLLLTAILGLTITPRVFASDKALQRGVTELVGSVVRTQPQPFQVSVRPEERSLIDWVRTLNNFPEPDKYTGQKVKVQGFAIHPSDLGKEYLFLARFVLTCCAADAYPVGLPVKLQDSRDQYPPDTWLEVEGQMVTETLFGKRRLTIASTSVKQIPQPKNPYEY